MEVFMSKRTPAAKSRQLRSRKSPEIETTGINTDISPLKESDPKKSPFNPETLDRTVIAIPLLRDLEQERSGKKEPKLHAIIIDLNLEFPGGRNKARQYVKEKLAAVLDGLRDKEKPEEGIESKPGFTEHGIDESADLREVRGRGYQHAGAGG